MDKPTLKLDIFEGPLDLLLFLIKENKMDIYDIKISVITEQYIAYLNLMAQMDMDIATEFMVMASTLMYIKSKMLLPTEQVTSDEIDVEDPRAQLIHQLLEYKLFKGAAEILEQHELAMLETYSRDVSKEAASYTSRELLFDVSFYELLETYQALIARVGTVVYHEVEREEYTVEEKMESLKSYFDAQDSAPFSDIMKKSRSKNEIIVFFFAILELVRLKFLQVRQNEVFGEIWLFKSLNPS